jgi:hypothetical protein
MRSRRCALGSGRLPVVNDGGGLKAFADDPDLIAEELSDLSNLSPASRSMSEGNRSLNGDHHGF